MDTAKNTFNKLDIDRRIEPRNIQSEIKTDINTSKKNIDVRIDTLNILLPSEKYFDWTGKPGDSLCIPKNEGLYNVFRDYGREGVEFKNGFPDFSPFSQETIRIDNITTSREGTFRKAFEAMAEKWNKEKKDGRSDWTSRDVKDWKRDNNLDFHECEDGKTIQAVPHEVHDNIPHTGGHSLAVNKAVQFDK